MSDCIFCSIVAHEIPSNIVREDDLVVAIRDNAPQAPVHVLVMPRAHIASAAELGDDHSALWNRMLAVAQEIAQSGDIAADGYRLVVNVGSKGGQTVDHLHMHVLGGRQMVWPPG